MTVITPDVPVGTANESFLYANVTGSAQTLNIKAGSGTLHSIVINTAGTSSTTITIWDSLTATGTKIGTITGATSIAAGLSFFYDVVFNIGLTVVTATGTPGDYTVTYR